MDTVTVGKNPLAVAVNATTNRVYVVNYYSNTVSVIDGATNAVTSVTLGNGPMAVAVNATTGNVYVVNYYSNAVSVIDGATLAVTGVTVGNGPVAVAVNATTDKVYVTNANSDTVSVIGETQPVPPMSTPASSTWSLALLAMAAFGVGGMYGRRSA